MKKHASFFLRIDCGGIQLEKFLLIKRMISTDMWVQRTDQVLEFCFFSTKLELFELYRPTVTDTFFEGTRKIRPFYSLYKKA